MNQPEVEGRSRVVLLVSGRSVLASSLRAVLEPHGYRLRHASDAPSVPALIATDRPDVVILDEDLADRSLDLIEPEQGIGSADLPVLLYSAGSWSSLDRPAAARLRDVDDAAWDVVVEPIRSQDLLAKLERLHQLQSLWKASFSRGGSSGFDTLVHGLPILDSIASRSDSTVGCVIFGPTRPETDARDHDAHDHRLARVTDHIRGSDLHAWIGSSELVVILYGADIEGMGSFASRIAQSEDRELSAGIASLEPPAYSRGAGSTPRTRLRALERVAAARRALERARDAGGGVRVAAMP